MPRGRLTSAILPILAGTAAAMITGYAPRLSYASPAPLATPVQATWVIIGCAPGQAPRPPVAAQGCGTAWRTRHGR